MVGTVTLMRGRSIPLVLNICLNVARRGSDGKHCIALRIWDLSEEAPIYMMLCS